MKNIPEILNNKIKTNVEQTKNLLISDPIFADKIFSMICNVNQYTTDIVSSEVYKHYTKDKFPKVQELYEVVDLLDHLATGYDTETYNLIGKDFKSYDEIGLRIRQEINIQYNNDVNLIQIETIGNFTENYDEDFV